MPTGLRPADEVAKRLTLWEERRFEDRRAWELLLINRKARKGSCASAGLTPLHAPIAHAVRLLLVPVARPPRTSSPRCSPMRKTRTFPLLEPPPPPHGKDWDRPFAGLRCAALTAPGRTGTRIKRITDMLNEPGWVHANKIHAVLSALLCQISAGTLPSAARWLTRTRLCWQRKKIGKPSPTEMAELLRQTACESAPCHPPIQGLTYSPVARTEWQHQPDSVTSLTTGATFATNRDAEQGDVLGTIQSALVVGHARDTHRSEYISNPLEANGVCDEWFFDGKLRLHPQEPYAPSLPA